MSVKQLYENVSLRAPIGEREFVDYLNETLSELAATYNKYVFRKGYEGTTVTGVAGELPTYPQYFAALVYNILYLCSYDKEGVYKSEFVRLAKAANDGIRQSELAGKPRMIKRNGW